MGWIETTPDGQQVEHGHRLTDPATGRVVDGDLEQWLAAGAPGADGLRTGCSCGWVDPSPAPPRLPEQAVNWDRVRAAQEHDQRLGDHLLDPGPPPVVDAWMDHHIHTWWGHLARKVPGTNADQPLNKTLAAVAGLLGEAEEHPAAALNALRQIEVAIARARLLAETAAHRRGDRAAAPEHARVKIRVRGAQEDVAACVDAIRQGRLLDLSVGRPAPRAGFVDVYVIAAVP
jgi:hypothetical protein